MKKDYLLELLGWIGTALILIGYGLYSLGIVPDIIVYHILNCIGSIGVMLISGYRRVWQPFTINAVMGTFALIAILRHFL
jgi:hypothetical protein